MNGSLKKKKPINKKINRFCSSVTIQTGNLLPILARHLQFQQF